MHRVRFLRILLITLVLAASSGPFVPAAAAQTGSVDLRTLLDGEGSLRLMGRTLDREALTQLYESRDFEPIWIAAPEREAALVRALATVPEHGLDMAVFAVPKAQPAERELLLTDAFLRYATALARGRVNSAEIEIDWALSVPVFNAAATLDRAIGGDVAVVLAGLAPAAPAYKRLQDALARYRAIAAAGGWRRLPEGVKLQRGDSGAAVSGLRRRLAAEGYLPTDTPSDEFDEVLEEAIKLFQARHGIAVDGQVGHGTFQALNVSPAARIEQIRLNLERWREVPRDWPATRIEVNVPAATLTVIERGEPALTMRAVVGATDHPTPVLRARMSGVLFNPPWNVPASIIKNEIQPHVKRDPKYLERNRYVYLGRPGASPLQQLPGPTNALGRIKFEMSNTYDVYLHDTPSHPAFSKVLRALSHGCVRLEEPRQLAVLVLGTQAGWALDDIDRAVDAGETRRVPLARSLPVYLLYWTAFVDADGGVEFRDDIYARDRRLSAALAALSVPIIRQGGPL